MAILFTPAPDTNTKVSVTKTGLIISRFWRMNSSCSENWGVFLFFSHLVSCLPQVRGPWAIPSKKILCLTLGRSSPSHKSSESLSSSVSACVLSCFSCVFVTPWTITRWVPLSMGSPGKNPGVGCYALLQGIFQTQGSNLYVLYLLH